MTHLVSIDASGTPWKLTLYKDRIQIDKAICPPTTPSHLLENLNGWVVEHLEKDMKCQNTNP